METTGFEFEAVGVDGRTWMVPAEKIASPIPSHEFAVHRSLCPTDPAWSVSHINSGALLVTGETKADTIRFAIATLSGITAAQLDAGVAEARWLSNLKRGTTEAA